MNDGVIPLNEIGKIKTVKVYNQSYVDKQQKRITELGELLNSTLEENKDIYKKMADLDTALEDCTESLTDARIKIKELEKENAELKEINEGYCKSRDRLVSIGLPTFMSCKETVNKLKKAKEIIKQFLNDYPVITKELLDKLEQFIKEDK